MPPETDVKYTWNIQYTVCQRQMSIFVVVDRRTGGKKLFSRTEAIQ